VIAPARTGRERRRRIAVTSTDQGNNLMRSRTSPNVRVFLSVLIKFTAPRREDTPAKCREKIAKSTDEPEWPKVELRGG
jgi:hypothetical protein